MIFWWIFWRALRKCRFGVEFGIEFRLGLIKSNNNWKMEEDSKMEHGFSKTKDNPFETK